MNEWACACLCAYVVCTIDLHDDAGVCSYYLRYRYEVLRVVASSLVVDGRIGTGMDCGLVSGLIGSFLLTKSMLCHRGPWPSRERV